MGRTSTHSLRLATSSVVLLATLSGCCTSKQCQLEQIAKDWCYTIRASQIIPVYPLTEDLQPGDIFLVKVPIQRQQEVYRDKGFLPLDTHIARLPPEGYAEFYRHSVLGSVAPGTLFPRHWMRPNGSIAPWQEAPGAAFPSYSFSVRRGSGLNVAVPVQGIPVGLSLMGSDSADGSISIGSAKTIGVDTISMFAQLGSWAIANRDFLANFAPPDGAQPHNYLRIVTRVYATGKLDIQLNDASSFAGGLDVGAAKPVDLLDATPPTGAADTQAKTIDNYKANLTKLNESLQAPGGAAQGLAPGGSLRVNAAGGRSVSLAQSFDPPLVLGYLGFDVAILQGGRIGRPVPTHVLLDNDRYQLTEVPTQTAELTIATGALDHALYGVVKAMPDDATAKTIVAAFDSLDALAPATGFVYRTGRTTGSGPNLAQQDFVRTTGYDTFRAYRDGIASSIRAIENALANDTFTYTPKGGQPQNAAQARSGLTTILTELRKEFERVGSPAAERRAIHDTIQLLTTLATRN